jgi:hypothetical protein
VLKAGLAVEERQEKCTGSLLGFLSHNDTVLLCIANQLISQGGLEVQVLRLSVYYWYLHVQHTSFSLEESGSRRAERVRMAGTTVINIYI